MIDGPTRGAETAHEAWAGRPWFSRAIRLVALLAPTAVSFAITFSLSRTVPPHVLGINTGLWWVGIFLIGVATLILVDKAARRLLPLAALFKLSLAFPDAAPSRFAVAMRTGTTRQLQRRIEEIRATGIEDDETTFAETMLELVAALSVHDRLTRGHCERVRAYTDMVIDELGLPEHHAQKLRWAALLHDVGKLMVPAEVLSKDGRPNESEWEQLKSHTWQGDRLIEPLKPWLGEWAAVIGSHHERWDGNGYPNGLAGENIHLGARIVAVVDAFDVMTSARSYKKPISAADARAEIARCAGGQFDPHIVRAFLNIGLGRLRLAIGPLSWAANLPATGQAVPVAPTLAPVATGATAVVTAVAAAVTGGFGGVLSPDAPPPETVAMVEAETPSFPTLPPTTAAPLTTAGPASTTPAPPPTTPPTTTPPTTPRPAATSPRATVASTTTILTTTIPPTTIPRSTTTPATTAPTTTTTAPPPRALANSVDATEDTVETLDLMAITDEPVVFRITSQPGAGLVEHVGSATTPRTPTNGTATASVRFTPAPNETGITSFRFTACPSARPDRCSEATVTLSIAAINDPPTIAVGPLQTDEDTELVLSINQLLADNIADPDHDDSQLSVSFEHTDPGTKTVTTSEFKLQPGSDSTVDHIVDITVCDPDLACVTENVVVSVNAVNDPPVLAPLAPVDVAVGVAITPVAAAATDVESDGLTFSATGLPDGLTISPTGQITGTPTDPADLGAIRTATVTVTDDGIPIRAATETIEFRFDSQGLSPAAGSIVLTEVRHFDGFNDFVEITNVSGADMDIDSWTLQDHAPGAAFDVNQFGQDRSVIIEFPTAPTSLAPNDVFVIDMPDLFVIESSGDDIWILDENGLIVDFVGWERTGTTTSQLVDIPSARLGIWDASYHDDLARPSIGQSISLATFTDANTSGCWEQTASGDAGSTIGRCGAADVFPTQDRDTPGQSSKLQLNN